MVWAFFSIMYEIRFQDMVQKITMAIMLISAIEEFINFFIVFNKKVEKEKERDNIINALQYCQAAKAPEF